MFSVKKKEATVFDLPGRTVNVFIGGEALESARMTVGLTEVPPKSNMAPHTHEDKEEIIYVVEGHGIVRVGDSTEEIEPHTAVLFPLGVEHVVSNTSDKTLKFVFMFNPTTSFS
jgi:quercetin dioxygenase-like cupin family protein